MHLFLVLIRRLGDSFWIMCKDDSILEKMAVAWGARRLSEMGGVNFLAELLSGLPT